MITEFFSPVLPYISIITRHFSDSFHPLISAFSTQLGMFILGYVSCALVKFIRSELLDIENKSLLDHYRFMTRDGQNNARGENE